MEFEMESDSGSMDCIIFDPAWTDSSLAKIRLKIINKAFEWNLDSYNSDCAVEIYNYLIIYMKSFIRSMARHKRRYKVVCPILTRKIEIEENKTISKQKEAKEESPVKPKVKVVEKLNPWQGPINWDVVKKENIKISNENVKDINEKRGTFNRAVIISKSKQYMGSQSAASSKTVGECSSSVDKITKSPSASSSKTVCECSCSDDKINKSQSASSSKTVGECSGSVDKITKSARNKKNTQETAEKKAKECVTPEVVYKPNKFCIEDMEELLKTDFHLIPQKPIYDIFKINILQKQGLKTLIF